MRAFTITLPKLLLVEGQDEVSFFEAWFYELGVVDVLVVAYEGKTKLADFLQDLPKARGFERITHLAVLRDADDNPNAAQESVQHAISNSPSLVTRLNPRHFVLPNGQSPGALESLWLESLKDLPFGGCVDAFFECLQSVGWEPSQVFAKNDKARAQVWIATKTIPNERFGLAAWHGRKNVEREWMRERWVDFSHHAFDPIRSFIFSALELEDQNSPNV